MSNIGQPERATQDRVVQFFQNELGYDYYGNWQYRADNRNIETERLSAWLTARGVAAGLITRALRQLEQAAALGGGRSLYDANKAVYSLLRYGVKVKPGAGEQTQTVWLVDWDAPANNEFAIAEEVTVKGTHTRRPDVVLYLNGIAVGVIELKSGRVDVAKGIRQNYSSQEPQFLQRFFSTMQLVMAGNDTQGLRYGTIETSEKYYLNWKEEHPDWTPQTAETVERYVAADDCRPHNNLLDCALMRLCSKERIIELLHHFIVFDMGTKKLPRHNQYFGVKAAQKFVARHENGIVWHTQGAGKSLTMVWLAKWIREHNADARVLVITDRTELDEQIEGVFKGVDEAIYRTASGADLIDTLQKSQEWLICSLVHKFGSGEDDTTTGDAFIREMEAQIELDFAPKGDLFVFVDECHRTQSGRLNESMQTLLPDATFIGFTGTPLLKKDKGEDRTSIEVFGRYIHTYKFDEAVRDGIVLDLRYEARDIDQHITSPAKIDQWFEAKTRNVTDTAKEQLKQKWGTMKKVLSSRSRLEQIVQDILLDMDTRPRLMDGRGNAMLVCASIYQACKVYEMFSEAGFGNRCAIVTSYKPSPADLRTELSGAGQTEAIHQYKIYRQMIADYYGVSKDEALRKVGDFEKAVKKRFKNEPGQMRLLIVVDKLLTGFDAPSATYLYIDKKMRDHGLFQAICRVNRLDGEDKEYGYIIDYKDLFNNLEGAIGDYTGAEGGALDGYDAADVQGLLSDRLTRGAESLDNAREQVLAICEPVPPPKDDNAYWGYFVGATDDKTVNEANRPKRMALYKAVNAFVRSYTNIATEMGAAGYSQADTGKIKREVEWHHKLVQELKIMSSDYVDMKLYEPAMRRMLDLYIRADDSEKISDFDDLGLVQLIVENGIDAGLEAVPKSIRDNEAAMAETIENNVRRIIVEEQKTNPTYYAEMSELLDALIEQRRADALEYRDYLEKIKALATQVHKPAESSASRYPTTINTRGKQAIYDHIKDEVTAAQVDTVIRHTKKDGWTSSAPKRRELRGNILRELGSGYEIDIDKLMTTIQTHDEYQ